MSLEEIPGFEYPVPAEVYQDEIGVRAGLQPPLAREAEAPGRVSGADGCRILELSINGFSAFAPRREAEAT